MPQNMRKNIDLKMLYHPSFTPPQFHRNSSITFKLFNNFVHSFPRVHQMGCKYFIKPFHFLRGVDLNKTIKKIDLITGPK